MTAYERTFSAVESQAQAPTEYRRRLGVLRDPAVRADIARLDAERDCQRIVQLLVTYEFPWDMVRSLELALFHTYGSCSVSRLLDRTGEFVRRGQKRYDDTALLIGHFVEAGYDSERGRRAIARMNQIHARFRIPNDDYLFVLWTFIDFPIAWLSEYGYRALTEHEQRAWFNFWTEVGRRMQIRDIPRDKPALDAFVRDYEAREMVFDEANRRVARATIAIMQAWLPASVRRFLPALVSCLVRPQLRAATGLADPPRLASVAVHAALKLRARVKKVVCSERYPSLLDDRRHRSYPNGYRIEQLGPFDVQSNG